MNMVHISVRSVWNSVGEGEGPVFLEEEKDLCFLEEGKDLCF